MVVCAGLAIAGLRLLRLALPARASAQGSDRSSRPVPMARIALFGSMLVLYGGTEAALGGWMAEHTRRVGGQTASVHWEFAATAFWGGLVAGRAVVAFGLSARREGAAALGGLTLASGGIGALLMAKEALATTMAAVLAGIGLAPVFPVIVAALSREVSPRIGAPLIALGALGGATIPWLVGEVSDRAGSLESGLGALLAFSIALLGLHVVHRAGRRPTIIHSAKP
jgi:fucose permease